MKRIFLIIILCVLCVFIFFRQSRKNHYDLINAVSGATPLAVAKTVPHDFSLVVDGMVKQTYTFSDSALAGFASTRIRVAESDENGDFTGAYIYVGIPVFNILEGIAPEKPDGVPFNQPVDLIARFTASDGATREFSYNEIIMTDDQNPVTLAYFRQPIVPTNEKVQETYNLNENTTKLNGLRLIAPGDHTFHRYLDNVVKITLTTLSTPDDQLPKRVKKAKCTSHEITCIDGDSMYSASLENVQENTITHWSMISHGHGYEKTVSIHGYDVRSFLVTNFREIHPDDFFLFVACDGYRCTFSGHEIFKTDDGKDMLIVDMIDNKPTKRGYRMASPADFFMDRSMWGLSHIVRSGQ